MRELLFRGQQRKKGEKVRLDGSPVESSWFYGNGVFQSKGDFSIIYQSEPEFSKHSVYSDTVGQYTGLTDKNGVKIFEGDIVEDIDAGLLGRVIFATATNGYDGMAGFMVDDIDDGLQNYNSFWGSVEVIGNIHDNPELLDCLNLRR